MLKFLIIINWTKKRILEKPFFFIINNHLIFFELFIGLYLIFLNFIINYLFFKYEQLIYLYLISS